MTVVIRDPLFYFIDKKLAAYNGIFRFQLNAPTFILQEILTNIKSDIKKNLLCTCVCLCKLSAGILYRCACLLCYKMCGIRLEISLNLLLDIKWLPLCCS